MTPKVLFTQYIICFFIFVENTCYKHSSIQIWWLVFYCYFIVKVTKILYTQIIRRFLGIYSYFWRSFQVSG